MRGAVNSTDWTHRLDHYARLLIIAWTILVGSLLAFNLIAQDAEVYDAARDVARTAYLKDVAYRRWASLHGGVYVPIDANTPPNPYLANLPERDITTPSGKQLTLINPAYMVRQVLELQAQSDGILGHLTSLNPIRPENAPDAWEAEALKSFERGAPEASTIATINGVAYMRVMHPLVTEPSCVNCHTDYAVGSLRGGLSVAVPMQPLWDANRLHAITLPIGHGLMWLIGLALIGLGRSRIRQQLDDRQAIETALRDSEARYRALIQQSPVSIVITDLNGSIEYVNSKFAAASGYTFEEVLGKNPRILQSGEMTRAQYKVLWDTILAGGTWRGELHNKKKSGELYWEFASISGIKNAAGVITHFLAVKEDITERKRVEQAEREQRRLAEALRDTAADLNSTLQFDVVLERILVNVERVVPHDEANIMLISGDTAYVCQSRGQAINLMPMAHLSISQTPHLRQMIDTGQPVIIPDVARHPDWSHHAESEWVRSYLSAPIRAKGETVGFINLDSATPNFFNADHATRLAIFANQAATAVENARLYQQAQTELSERRKVEDQLQQAKDAAEAANQAKSVFLANMSHELRTPLNAILGFAQLLSHAPNLNVDQQDDLAIIQHSGQHLLDLINDVLDMSKIESGRMSVRNSNFDLSHLLDDLEEMFRLRAVEKGLALIVQIDPDLPRYVRADESKLRQVLINLLGNAVKFTGSGRVTLRATYAPDRLHFEIEDTGPGLTAHELAVVFDPFVQIDGGQKTQDGTGLGLSISQQFVRLMGGDITAVSEAGQGSVFKFDVKIEVVDAADVPLAHRPRRVIGLAPHQPTYRLLIVDDRETSRKLLTKMLAPLGFDIREATDGREALEIWEQWEPHLIWLDMRMPIMDGHEVTRRIKATARGQTTVIIALTASAFQEERDVILSAGCDDFVRKPFSEDDIYDRLTKHLGVRFVYDDATPPAEQRPIDPLRPAVALSSDWLDQLRQATIQADLDRIQSLIEHIRPQAAALADQLADWARNFNYDQIARFAEHAAIHAGRRTS